MNNFKEIKKFVTSFLKKQKKNSKDFQNINDDVYELFVEKFLKEFKNNFHDNNFKKKSK